MANSVYPTYAMPRGVCPKTLYHYGSSVIIYMSSVLHLYLSFSTAFLSACLAYICFSKPLDLSTPSHLYPGIILNLLGGGGGPLYLGFSVKRGNKSLANRQHQITVDLTVHDNMNTKQFQVVFEMII